MIEVSLRMGDHLGVRSVNLGVLHPFVSCCVISPVAVMSGS